MSGTSVAALLALLFLPASSHAQAAPERRAIDENGYDLLSGRPYLDALDISIGSGRSELSFRRIGSGSGIDNFDISLIHDYPYSPDYLVQLPDRTVRFPAGVSALATGETLDGNGFTDRNGVRYEFGYSSGLDFQQSDGIWRATKITSPDGSVIRVHWAGKQVTNATDEGTYVQSFDRIQSITNDSGYQFKLEYPFDCPALNECNPDYYTLSKVTAINNAVEACDPEADHCTLTHPWRSVNYAWTADSSKLTVSGPGNRVRTYDGYGSIVSGDVNEEYVLSVDVPFTITLRRHGRAVTYKRQNPYVAVATDTVATDALGHQKRYSISSVGTASRIDAVTDELNRTTSYTYDSSKRITRVTLPDQNYTNYTYDARGNVTETRVVAKPGSGLADIVTTAVFPATCSSPKSCNKPTAVTDARGQTTNYTYDAVHGGVTSVTLPASPAGVRPQTRVSYAPASSSYDGTSTFYLPTGSSACQTGATCTGTSDEVVTSLSYAPASGNFQPISSAAGSGSAPSMTSASVTYDTEGNVISATDALGATSYGFYDANRRSVGMIGPDPDGGGPLARRATRLSYTPEGLVSLTEQGAVTGTSAAALSGMSVAQSVATIYDADHRKSKEVLKSGGVNYRVTQYSYNSLGLPKCSALRMNPGSWDSQSDACSMTTAGPAGSDRITYLDYDELRRVKSSTSGYLSADVATERTAYNPNGTTATYADANGNLTTLEYDGFDRLVKTRYPNTTVGSGASSTTDYEQLVYDANGNVTSRRLRGYAGDTTQHIDYSYDNLNRVTFKGTPDAGADVTITYDLLNRPTMVGTSGQSLYFTYDALGRKLSESGPVGTMTSQYDAAGRRTSLTWPDGFYINYDYAVTGEMKSVRENGATAGVGLLATYSYDNLGRRTGLTRGNGTITSYGFDNVSQLSSLGHDVSGTAYDLNLGFTRNPAGQIASVTRSNDAYAYAGNANTNLAYMANGLNQMTSVGAGALGYDAKGNLVSTGSNTYIYSSENLMRGGPGGNVLNYDPLLRLFQVNTTSRFGYDGQDMVGEYTTSNVLTKRYVYGSGTDEPLVWYEGSGTGDRRWFHADERGSIVAVTNSSGAAIAVNSYDEYGVPATGNVGRFQYTGQAYLPELGLYYYKARIYSSRLGRFMQTDPIGYGDGMNLYAYVGGDPVNLNDPSGLLRYCQDDNPSHCYDDGAEDLIAMAPSSASRYRRWWVDWSSVSPLADGQARDRARFAVEHHSMGAPRKEPQNNLTAPDMPFYQNSCITGALLSGAKDAAIDAIGLIPVAGAAAKSIGRIPVVGGIARSIGHTGGYRGVVADQYGARAIGALGKTAGIENGAIGLSSDPTSWVSAGLTVAGFIPGAGQISTIASLAWDVGVTAYKVYKCPR